MKPRLSEHSVLTLCLDLCMYVCIRCYKVTELSFPVGTKDNCSLRCFCFSLNLTKDSKSSLGIPLQQVFKLEWPNRGVTLITGVVTLVTGAITFKKVPGQGAVEASWKQCG